MQRLIDRLSPPLVLCLLYLTLVGLGAALLLMPGASTRPITVSDAVFTATSAVTVTGLVVIDTGSDLTVFGQAVVVFLIQIGGIGIITFTVLMLRALGMPIGFQHKIFLRDDLNRTSIRDVLTLAWQVFKISLLAEILGTIALAYAWVPELGGWQGAWYAIFHCISAFNNAGFGLHAASLTPWAGNPLVIVTTSLLFVIGGLGYGVIDDVAARRSWATLTLHSKLTLAGTAALLVWGSAAFAVLEWNNPGTLGAMSIGDKLMTSWFQGATPRTAGFNSVDYAKIRESTSFLDDHADDDRRRQHVGRRRHQGIVLPDHGARMRLIPAQGNPGPGFRPIDRARRRHEGVLARRIDRHAACDSHLRSRGYSRSSVSRCAF